MDNDEDIGFRNDAAARPGAGFRPDRVKGVVVFRASSGRRVEGGRAPCGRSEASLDGRATLAAAGLGRRPRRRQRTRGPQGVQPREHRRVLEAAVVESASPALSARVRMEHVRRCTARAALRRTDVSMPRGRHHVAGDGTRWNRVDHRPVERHLACSGVGRPGCHGGACEQQARDDGANDAHREAPRATWGGLSVPPASSSGDPSAGESGACGVRPGGRVKPCGLARRDGLSGSRRVGCRSPRSCATMGVPWGWPRPCPPGVCPPPCQS